MNLFSSGLSNIFSSGVFGNTFPIVMEEREYPNISPIRIVDNILDTFRGIEADRLTQEKELAEIEAKVVTYSEYTNFHRDTLNKSYELERKELELIQMVTAKSIGLLERMEKLNDDNPNYKTYIELMNRYQKILEKMLDNSGRYFNEKTMEANKIDIPEFIKYTEIGKY